MDFIEIDPDRFGLVLGDVAGKGLGAALFMAKLQSTLRALVFNFESLAGIRIIIKKLNSRIGVLFNFLNKFFTINWFWDVICCTSIYTFFSIALHSKSC